MKQVFGAQKRAWIGIISVLAMLVWSGCGGGSGGSDDGATGQVSFRVQWERDARTAAPEARTGVNDCLDVETVTAAVYTNNDLLQEGGPWNCADGQATISGIPAGNTVWVAISGLGATGRVLYFGQSDAFYLASGVTYNAGTIVADSFIPTLWAPEDSAFVAPGNLMLRWNTVDGANGYRVILYADSDFISEVQSISVSSSPAPSYQPDTAALNIGAPYYWRVQAVDGVGNVGEFSEGRRFTLSNENLAVDIIRPGPDSPLYSFLAIDFAATVSDPGGNILSAGDLASVVWRSDVQDVIGNTLDFTTNLSAGAHVISLDVRSTDGLSGTAEVTVYISN